VVTSNYTLKHYIRKITPCDLYTTQTPMNSVLDAGVVLLLILAKTQTLFNPLETIMLIKKSSSTFIAFCLLFSQFVLSAPQQEDSKSNLIDHYTIGGEGGWDLLTLDSKHHRLFVSRSSHVQVIDTETKKLVGDILETNGVHGIALADDLHTGFTSNGKSNSVTAFDLTTLKVIDTINVSGVNPDVILYEPISKHLFVFNGRSANASVIDAVTRKEITTIALSGKPELAVSDDSGKVFVNIENKSEIAIIDSATNTVVKTFHVGTGEEPTGLAIDKAHHRLFSVCDNNKMVILDDETGKVIAEVKIGSGPDSAAFDPAKGIALSSNGDGTLTLIKENDPEHFSVVKNIATQKGARTMAYDAVNHRAYLVTAAFGPTPAATKDLPKPRPEIIPNTFEVLVVSL